jgi:hypothetical protein
MNEGSDIIDIIKKIKNAGIGDIEKINTLEEVVKFGKPLTVEDEEYLIKLLYQLEGHDISKKSEKELPKLNMDDFKNIVESYKSHYTEKAKEKFTESKFKLAGGKFCTRCTKKLSFKKYKPHKNWGLTEFLCKGCYDEIGLKVADYKVILKEADVIPSTDKKLGILSIQNFDNTKRIVFGNKNFPDLLSIPVEKLTSHEIIDYEEKSSSKKLLTMGLKKTKTSSHLLIVYQSGEQNTHELIIASKELAKISTSLGHLILEFQKESFSKKDFETNPI